METYIRIGSFRKTLNQLFRRTKYIDVTKLTTKVVTVRNAYKNKQIIDVSANIHHRFNQKI